MFYLFVHKSTLLIGEERDDNFYADVAFEETNWIFDRFGQMLLFELDEAFGKLCIASIPRASYHARSFPVPVMVTSKNYDFGKTGKYVRCIL